MFFSQLRLHSLLRAPVDHGGKHDASVRHASQEKAALATVSVRACVLAALLYGNDNPGKVPSSSNPVVDAYPEDRFPARTTKYKNTLNLAKEFSEHRRF